MALVTYYIIIVIVKTFAGTTSQETRLGATADLELCLRIKADQCGQEDVMVVAGDMMFQEQKFDMSHITKYFQSKRDEGDLAIYYEVNTLKMNSIFQLDYHLSLALNDYNPNKWYHLSYSECGGGLDRFPAH